MLDTWQRDMTDIKRLMKKDLAAYMDAEGLEEITSSTGRTYRRLKQPKEITVKIEHVEDTHFDR